LTSSRRSTKKATFNKQKIDPMKNSALLYHLHVETFFIFLSLFFSFLQIFLLLHPKICKKQKDLHAKAIRQYLESWKHLSTCLNKYFHFNAKFLIAGISWSKRKTSLKHTQIRALHNYYIIVTFAFYQILL